MRLIQFKKLVTFFFFGFAFLDVVLITIQHDELRYLSKPFLMPLLIVLYFLSVPKVDFSYLLALSFAFVGDVVLMLSGKLFFIIGLVSFLLGHLLYILIVAKHLEKQKLLNVIIMSLLYILLDYGFISFLKPSLNNLVIPVIIYTIVITTFSFLATLNFISKANKMNSYFFLGALFFIISDGLLAINKFEHSTLILNIVVMLTYVIAQFLIFKALVSKNELSQNKKAPNLGAF